MSQRWTYGMGLVLLCLALYYTVVLDGDAGVLSDSAMYVILAEALANGRGYTEVSSAGDPVYLLAPPLFPLLLSSLVYFFGRNFVLMKTFVLIFAFVALWLIYVLGRERLGELKALLITTVVALSLPFFRSAIKSCPMCRISACRWRLYIFSLAIARSRNGSRSAVQPHWFLSLSPISLAPSALPC